MIFDEKLNEYRFHHPNFTLNEHLKKNTTISLDATGVATDELVNFFSLPEYMMIELNPLYNLKESGNTKQTTTNTNDVDVQDKLSNNSSTVFNDFEYNQQITTDSVPLITLTNSDDVAFMHSMSICQNDTSQINVLLNDNTEQSENIGINNIDSSSGGTTTLHRSAVDNVLVDEPKTKEKKRKKISEQEAQEQLSDNSDVIFWFPPAWRLRSKTRSNHNSDGDMLYGVEEACVLYLNTDSSSESGTANIRLRLTDSIDSFSGFVCKTKQVNELKSGVLLSIEAFHMESLGNNKVVCKIVNMTIIREIQGVNAKETNGSIVDSSRDKSDSSTPQQQLLLINLGDVDLGSGKNNMIRGRFTSKSAVGTYDVDQHKFFYFNIMDDSTTLRVKAFDHQCDRIFPNVCIGEIDDFYDVIGVIKSISPATTVHERITFKPLTIVRLLLFDSTGKIEINIWNAMASDFIGQKMIFLRSNIFDCVSITVKKIVLNSTMDSEIFLNPDCKEADKLRSLIASPILNNSETTNFNTKCFVDMGQNMSLNEDLIHSMKKMRLNNSNVESIKNKNAGVFRILDLTPPCSPFRKQSDGEYDVLRRAMNAPLEVSIANSFDEDVVARKNGFTRSDSSSMKFTGDVPVLDG
ncbi:unnamed protein product, partial [Rotaria magnacalcarata]